jgi:hypothetical protein
MDSNQTMTTSAESTFFLFQDQWLEISSEPIEEKHQWKILFVDEKIEDHKGCAAYDIREKFPRTDRCSIMHTALQALCDTTTSIERYTIHHMYIADILGDTATLTRCKEHIQFILSNHPTLIPILLQEMDNILPPHLIRWMCDKIAPLGLLWNVSVCNDISPFVMLQIIADVRYSPRKLEEFNKFVDMYSQTYPEWKEHLNFIHCVVRDGPIHAMVLCTPASLGASDHRTLFLLGGPDNKIVEILTRNKSSPTQDVSVRPKSAQKREHLFRLKTHTFGDEFLCKHGSYYYCGMDDDIMLWVHCFHQVAFPILKREISLYGVILSFPIKQDMIIILVDPDMVGSECDGNVEGHAICVDSNGNKEVVDQSVDVRFISSLVPGKWIQGTTYGDCWVYPVIDSEKTILHIENMYSKAKTIVQISMKVTHVGTWSPTTILVMDANDGSVGLVDPTTRAFSSTTPMSKHGRITDIILGSFQKTIVRTEDPELGDTVWTYDISEGLVNPMPICDNGWEHTIRVGHNRIYYDNPLSVWNATSRAWDKIDTPVPMRLI